MEVYFLMGLTMQETPKSIRMHIGLYGRRNVGKSSILNAITRQHVSIVSEVAGTTTDPVEKPMELLPLGPVLFIDTAGIDDVGKIGELRIEKTKQMLDRTDLGVIVTEANFWSEFEERMLAELKTRQIPTIVILNKVDLFQPSAEVVAKLQQSSVTVVYFSAAKQKVACSEQDGDQQLCRLENETYINRFRQAILDNAPQHFFSDLNILRDLVFPGEIVIQVIPIDNEAPKGRLLLPQHQAIRDALDGDTINIVIKESQLKHTLNCLRQKPKLVVTDSSIFNFVAQQVPEDIWLTGYSILFARLKGDLTSQVVDTMMVDKLKPGDKVLISEACTHHPIGEDIGRVKIPQRLQKFLGFELRIDVVQGRDFPKNLAEYKLVIHCGACMFNRREMLNRIMLCRSFGVPITNYGLLLGYISGIFSRVLEPFPDALTMYLANR